MRKLIASTSLVLATAAAVVVPTTPAVAKPKVGIADNKADMFTDPRFKALGVRYARLNLAWDAPFVPAEKAKLDVWMAGARATGARVLITFDRSPARPSYNPKPKELVASLKALRAAYPGQVKDIATWNEANINKSAKTVAAWWLALQKACRSCKVLAADLVDTKGFEKYARKLARAAKKEPKLWGLHNYVDVNRFTTKSTRKFLENTQGEVWLTETGGVDNRKTPRVRFAGTGPVHAEKALRYLFTDVAALSPRIKRVYVYHWNAPDGLQLTWDSALVGTTTVRPSLAVFQQALAGRIKGKKPKKKIKALKNPVRPGGKVKGKGKK